MLVLLTWASTSMARYWNMSCRSLILFSSFRISSCRDSISFSACFVALASIRICGDGVRVNRVACCNQDSEDNWFWAGKFAATSGILGRINCYRHRRRLSEDCLPRQLSSLSDKSRLQHSEFVRISVTSAKLLQVLLQCSIFCSRIKVHLHSS